MKLLWFSTKIPFYCDLMPHSDLIQILLMDSLSLDNVSKWWTWQKTSSCFRWDPDRPSLIDPTLRPILPDVSHFWRKIIFFNGNKSFCVIFNEYFIWYAAYAIQTNDWPWNCEPRICVWPAETSESQNSRSTCTIKYILASLQSNWLKSMIVNRPININNGQQKFEISF